MNNQQTDAAVGGLALGAAATMGRWARSQDDRARRADRAAHSAKNTAEEALGMIERFLASGDSEWLTSNQVRDFLLGLAVTAQCNPNACPTLVPSANMRPVLTEDMGAGITPWPGFVNPYNDEGNPTNVPALLSGQNVGTGLALGYAEVRAMLLGLTQPSDVNAALARQYFRLGRGLADVLPGFLAGGGSGLTQQQMDQAWQRFFAVPPAGPSVAPLLILGELLAEGAIVSNTTAETELARLPIPANTVTRVGQVLDVSFHAAILARNGTDTNQFKVRLDSLTGTTVYDSSALGIAAGGSVMVQEKFWARQVGSSGFISGVTYLPVSLRFQGLIDWTQPHNLILTVTQSAASSGNQVNVKDALITLLG